MSKRIFAIEEAYVSIFEEYSPFWNAPVAPRSRIFGPSGWQITYDLTGRSNMQLPASPLPYAGQLNPLVRIAKWTDIFMTDLRWEKKPITVEHQATGMSFQYAETIGSTGTIGFNAADYGQSLWQMMGYRRFWRVFVDVKQSSGAQVERSWEFRGCWVDGNSFSGSPVSIARSFNVREIPETDASYTLTSDFRVNTYKQLADPTLNGGLGNIGIEVLSIGTSRYANLVPGIYDLTVANSTAGAGYYDITYGGTSTVTLPAVKWTVGRELILDGGYAGSLTLKIVTASPNADTTNPAVLPAKDRILVSK